MSLRQPICITRLKRKSSNGNAIALNHSSVTTNCGQELTELSFHINSENFGVKEVGKKASLREIVINPEVEGTDKENFLSGRDLAWKKKEE